MRRSLPPPPEPGLRPPPRRRRGWLPRRKPKPVKVSTSLRLMHEVLGLEHLHFGLWDGEPLNLEGVKKAQERYTETLCDWVPEGVRSILDVGCGTGSTALELKERGFEVEGLAPDPYLQEIFVRRTGLPFHLARFQDFRPKRSYDLILMSESAQYIWLDYIYPAVRQAVPGGYLLVADYFVIENDGGPAADSGHPLDAFLAKAERYGFELLRRQDVTAQAAPTLELAARWHDDYGLPILRILADNAADRHPYLYRLADRLLGKRLRRKLDQQRTLWDPELFRRIKRYELMLFRAPAVAAAPAERSSP